MIISAQKIKELREKTGAGVSDVKKALEASAGDIEKAYALIERALGSVAATKAGRETKSGLIEAYVHSNSRVASLVEIFCETDFVARTPAFKEFAHDIAMHVAAMDPSYLSLDEVPDEVWNAQRARFQEEARGIHESKEILDQIVDEKLKAYFGSRALLSQPFIKDQDKTVEEVLKEAIGRFGENTKIGKFVRFKI